jgi:hypothetical protein
MGDEKLEAKKPEEVRAHILQAVRRLGSKTQTTPGAA